jgi:hypothetical protein
MGHALVCLTFGPGKASTVKFFSPLAEMCTDSWYFNIHTVHFRRIRNDQQYVVISTFPLFYVLAPTCFGSSLPSSGSFLDPSELL